MKLIIATIALCTQLFMNSATAAGLELHSHAFMKHGMGPLLRGDFHSPTKSSSWKSLLATNLNEETLIESDIDVFVVSLYAVPVVSLVNGGMRTAIRKQIQEAKDFVKDHPEWHLAKNATEAWRLYQQGKKIMIFSLEGAGGILNNEADLDEFITEHGIAIVTPIHLTDSRFGGAAYMRGFRKTFFTTKLFSPKKVDGVKINFRGATKKGKWLVEELIKRGAWVDLTHSSDLFQKDILPILDKYNHPILFTHVSLRKYYQAERALSKWAIKQIQKREGIVGLMPSEEMLVDTVIPDKFCPEQCRPCQGSTPAFVAQWNELAQQIGEKSIVLGSDFNGGITHLPPNDCSYYNPIDDPAGFYLFSQIPLFWDKVTTLSPEMTQNHEKSISHFFKLWIQVQSAKN